MICRNQIKFKLNNQVLVSSLIVDRSVDYMLASIYLAYQRMALLQEAVPISEDI